MAPIPLSKWLQEIKIEKPLISISHSIDAITVKTLNIGTPRPATVVVLNIKQFNFTMK